MKYPLTTYYIQMEQTIQIPSIIEEVEEPKQIQKKERDYVTLFWVILTAICLFVVAVFVREGAFG